MSTFLTNLFETGVYKYAPCTKCNHVYYSEDAAYCHDCDWDLAQLEARHLAPSRNAIQTNRVGNVLISVGYLILVFGQLLLPDDGVATIYHFNALNDGTDSSWQRYEFAILASAQKAILLMTVISAPFFYFGATRKRRASQQSMSPACDALERDPRATVLYLRSFGRDRIRIHTNWHVFLRFLFGGAYDSSLLKTFEEVLVEKLYSAGPVVAVCKPEESNKLPDIGAHRIVFANHWQQGVEKLADDAATIVLVLDTSPGLEWEINLALQPRYCAKLIMIIPLLRTRREERKYKTDYAMLRQKIPQLPEYNSALIAVDATPESQTLNAILGDRPRPNAFARAHHIDELISAKRLARLRAPLANILPGPRSSV